MAFNPLPGQGMGRMYGESGTRITEDELRQDAETHEQVEEAETRHPSWWQRLFRRGGRKNR